MTETQNQAKPKYCAYCEEEIPAGKEIKVYHDPTYYLNGSYGWGGWGWFSFPWWYDPYPPYGGPRSVYYLCPACYKHYQKKQREQTKRRQRGYVFFFIFISLFMLFSYLLVWWMFREMRK